MGGRFRREGGEREPRKKKPQLSQSLRRPYLLLTEEKGPLLRKKKSIPPLFHSCLRRERYTEISLPISHEDLEVKGTGGERGGDFYKEGPFGGSLTERTNDMGALRKQEERYNPRERLFVGSRFGKNAARIFPSQNSECSVRIAGEERRDHLFLEGSLAHDQKSGSEKVLNDFEPGRAKRKRGHESGKGIILHRLQDRGDQQRNLVSLGRARERRREAFLGIRNLPPTLMGTYLPPPRGDYIF